RIYIPLNALAEHNLTEADIVERRFDARYVTLMEELISRTREMFLGGLPLVKIVDGALRTDIELFSRGGLAVLDAIEAVGYNTLEHRPALTKPTKLRLLARALGSRIFSQTTVKDTAAPLSNAPSAFTSVSAGDVNSAPPAQPADVESVAASYVECNRIARAARSSFYLAFFGLPKQKRNALCALYAFMRLVDNISDDPGDLDSKRRGLARWRALLDEAVEGHTEGHAILPGLADTIAHFEIPTRYFHDLILGAEMDLTVGSYATFDRLSEYCYRVAGTVG